MFTPVLMNEYSKMEEYCIAGRGSGERTVEWPKFPTLSYAQGTEERNKDQTEHMEWGNADGGQEKKRRQAMLKTTRQTHNLSSAEYIFRNKTYLLELSIK